MLGTSTGQLFLFYSQDQIGLVANLPGRIVEINCLNDTGNSPEVLVHLHGSSAARYLILDTIMGNAITDEEIVGLDERFVGVSAALVDDLLAIGSRHGYLSLLSRSASSEWKQIISMSTRSKDAISAITPLPRTGSSKYILTTSRDGKYRVYEIQNRENRSVVLLHETSPPFGPMIEGAWFTNDQEPELILYGFRSKYFIIWNESRREELAAVDCGGAHRTFRVHRNGENYRFGFTRTSKLSLWSQDGISHRIVKTGTHGREIRALSWSGTYIASGAEDTSIRIWRPSDMRCLAAMKTHVTGIQKLCWFGDYLFSSGGNEEFFVARVRTFDSSFKGLAVMTEAVFSDKSPIGDLRIMDFDVSEGDDGLLVTLAFSNSTIKQYRYSQQTFSLLCEGHYAGSCITQLQHVSRSCIVTGSTDGHLALWTVDGGRFKLGGAIAMHQSSIKALDMVLNNGECGIVTGGDDNSLGFVALTQDSQSWKFAGRATVRSAHAAAINGVAWLGDLAVSVSNDQRVKVWRLDRRAQRIALKADVASGVADPGDVIAMEGRVVLGGVGVETWTLDTR